jgi:hypothetical protein
VIAGLSWSAWALLIAAVGTGLAIEVLFFLGYRRGSGGGGGGTGEA